MDAGYKPAEGHRKDTCDSDSEGPLSLAPIKNHCCESSLIPPVMRNVTSVLHSGGKVDVEGHPHPGFLTEKSAK
jgi:hypothetical protein